MSDSPGPRSCNRLFEWIMTLAIFSFGVQTIIFQTSIADSRFSSMNMLMSSSKLSIFCILVGAVRAGILFINGNLGRFGPQLRAAASSITGLTWLQLAVALMAVDHSPSPGISVYLSLCVGEVRTVWRAARDFSGLTSSD